MLALSDCLLFALRKFFKETDIPEDFLQELKSVEQKVDCLNLFTPLRLSGYLEGLLLTV